MAKQDALQATRGSGFAASEDAYKKERALLEKEQNEGSLDYTKKIEMLKAEEETLQQKSAETTESSLKNRKFHEFLNKTEAIPVKAAILTCRIPPDFERKPAK